MNRKTLGRTNLSVSVMGLGCGGHSRLGTAQGKGDDNAVAVVRRALELGVNFIDTAELYGTEPVVGRAIAEAISDTNVSREDVILSTKVWPLRGDTRRTAPEIVAAAEECLNRLQTDYIDILHLHGVAASDYAYCASEMVPALLSLKDSGKIRFLGITEQFINDPGHEMLTEGALKDDCWDVIMVGFSLLNQSARERVLPITQAKNIGVLDMFAVRRALSDPAALMALMGDLGANGSIDPAAFDRENPLGFLTAPSVARTIPEAAYRFCRDEPGIDVVLSGTGSVAHLDENAASLEGPPLPPDVTERLKTLFAGVDSVSGN